MKGEITVQKTLGIRRIQMKINNKSLVFIIVLFLIVSSFGCSDKKTDTSSDKVSTEIKKMQDNEKKSVKSKVDLLCMKYDVDSETLKNDLLEYLYVDSALVTLLDTNKGKKNDEKMEKLMNAIIYGEVIDTEKLLSMSKKHNVPISKISGIVYDYMIWSELKQVNEHPHTEHDE